MNLTWHIVLKDFRRLRVPLAVWSTLQLLAQLGPAFVWSLRTLPAEAIQFLLYTLAGIQAVSWLAAFDFAIRLIHEDSPLRTDAFWRTRPVSGLRLLTAKLTGLLLFTLLSATPALLAAAVLSSSPAATAFLEETLKTHLVIAACAIPFATLTRSFRQCLLVFLGVILFAAVVFLGVHVIYDPPGSDLYQPRMTLIRWIALLTVTAVVVHQFKQGRLPHSLRIAGTGTVLIIVAATLWPWRFPFHIPPLPPVSGEPAEARGLTLAYEKSRLWNEAEFWAPSLCPVLNIDFTVSGFPTAYFLRRKSIHHHWLAGASPSVRSPGGDGLSPTPDARVILGIQPPLSSPPSINIQSQIPADFAARLRSKQSPTPYHADIVLDLCRAEITEIPLRPGQSVLTTDSEIRLIEINAHTATLRLLERPFHPAASLAAIVADKYEFILYNPRTGETYRGGNRAFSIPSLKNHELTFGPMESDHPYVTSRTKPLTDDFLRDARLVKITFPIVGTFARTVEVDALQPHLSR